MNRRIPILLLALASLTPLDAAAQVSVTADLATRSRYLFAGMVFWAGPMTNPSVTLAATSGNGTLTINGGAVYMHGEYDELLELDLWGDYYHQVSDRVGAYVGVGYYNFKGYLVEGEYAGTPEVYGGLVLYVPLTPSVYVARDFDLTEGSHVTFSVTHSVPLGEDGVSLTFDGRLDYNHEYYRPDSGFSFADLMATLAVPVGRVTVSPMAAVQVGIPDDGYFGDWGLFGISLSMGLR